MFYVGDVLWLEEGESWKNIPDNYTGCLYDSAQGYYWFRNLILQSPQDPITGEWLPSVVVDCFNGTKSWHQNGYLQSFKNPVTEEWMPSLVLSTGSKFWHNKGSLHSFPSLSARERMPAIIYSNGTKEWYSAGSPINFIHDYEAQK